ncbi:MAG: hypothetical protein RJR37_14295 [Peptococcaceae bacterium MAG4]|nr:hypothetical protein [Peptococcaceae bacterium MAG4]
MLEEMDRQIKEKRAERQGWQIWRRGDRKEIVTRFGLCDLSQNIPPS